jgi:hypothetical protein
LALQSFDDGFRLFVVNALDYDVGGESGGAGGTGEGCYGVFAACEEGGGDEAAYIAAGLGGWSD